MNENYQAEAVETTGNDDVTTSNFADAFSDAWEDDGPAATEETEAETVETDGEASVEDQHDEVDTGNDNAAKAAEPETAKVNGDKAADQRFVLKRHGETRELDLSDPSVRDEATTLMQKGWDYDHKTTELKEIIAEYEGFIDELIGDSGMTREQLMDSTRARLLTVSEAKAGREISETDALLRVQRDRAGRKNKAANDAADAQSHNEDKLAKKRDESVKAFVTTYPGVDPKNIPQKVWDEVAKTGDLVSAYMRHENEELKTKISALENNAKNAQRSTGSMKTAGKGAPKTAFDAGWDDI